MATRPDQAAGWTLSSLAAHLRRAMQAAGLPDAGLEARILLEHCTRTGRLDAVSDPLRTVPAHEAGEALRALARRLDGEPVHRIVGWREFYGMRLELSSQTLEPRPDTETLVDLVLPMVRQVAARDGGCRVLDLGTGTGAIALALLSQEPRAAAVVCDILPGALAAARRNADMLGITERIETVHSDWFEGVTGRFDVIVSNPPYIESSVIASLQKEVREHDPREALDGGPDGLDAYRAIAAGAARHLVDGGCVALEFGAGQLQDVEAVFAGAGFTVRETASDLGGHVRAAVFAPAPGA